tara:strand:- start:1660 stop:1857 length:198 start_codon:yes stop_codon:yes gene_type:complete
MNKNEWLVSWSTKGSATGHVKRYSEERQYVNDVTLFIQKSLLPLEDLDIISIQPINRDDQPKTYL